MTARVETGMNSKQKWILVLAALAAFMTALDTLVVTTALSTIRRDLGASVEELEWTVNAYNLSFAVLLMTAAALGDRFGRRRVFVAGIGLFVAASAACAVAPSVGALIAARAVQGAGAAAVTTLALALVGAAFPPEKRGGALGIFFAVNGLAVAGGPLVGGAITQGIAWQWIFWLNVPIGLALIPLVLRRIPESHGPDKALDLPGLALVSGGVLGLVWGLVRGNDAGWASAEVLGAFAVAVVFLARLRRGRAADAGADAADALLPLAGVLGRQRGDLLRRRRPLLRGLLHGPVPPGRARLRPARRRPPPPALDGDALLRRPGGGQAGRPLRRAAVPGRRAAAAGDRLRLDRPGRRSGDVLLDPDPAADRRRRRHLDVLPGGAELGRQLGAGGGDRQGRGDQLDDA